ncbi:MAG: hypothetical protein Q9166_003198 [cf. Caloplaca sp. 2 TL-2023]
MATFSNLIRLVPLSLDDVPSHPALDLAIEQKRYRRLSRAGEIQVESTIPQKSTQRVKESEPETIDDNGRPYIGPFIKAIIDDAQKFVDGSLPATFKPGSEKPSSPAKTEVQLLKRNISAQEISTAVDWLGSKIPRHVPDHVEGEAWFARRSCHTNRQGRGTATMAEFDFALRIDHSEHEGEYTPDIFDTYKVLDWTIPDTSAEEESNFADYKHITLSVFEICHKLPFPLSTRVFPVLVVTAMTGTQDFIVVQLPIKLDTLPEAFYSNGRNLKEGDNALRRKKPIPGVYTSIERCVLRPDNQIEWTMATTSDAKGWLPMWTQKLGVPGAIAKDVGFVMEWISGKRAARDISSKVTSNGEGEGEEGIGAQAA